MVIWLATILLMTLAAPALAAEPSELPEKLVGHGGPVKAIAIAPGGDRALTGSFDYSIIEWELSGAEGVVQQRLFGHEAAVNDVEFVLGQRRAVSVGDDGMTIVWDLESGEAIKRFEDTGDKVLDTAVSADGALAAAARWDGTARVFDLETLEEIAVLKGHRGNVNAVAFSPDGDKVYTASYDGTIREWESRTGSTLRTIVSHGWGVNVMELTQDGGALVFGGIDGTLGVVDLGESLELSQIRKFARPVLSLAMSQDGGLMGVGTGAGEVVIFQTMDWSEAESNIHAFGPVWGLAFTPEGRHVYLAGLDDFAIAWQINPRKAFEPIRSVYPRRFQVNRGGDTGELEFRRKCSVCHTLGPDGGHRAGPTLYGLFGREAGSLPGYPYSKALLDSDIVWTEETVSALFDVGPDVLTPGTKMPVQRLKNVEHREDLVRYLKQATAPN